ncbi:MAG: MmcQ/YjbR family DNA-binding protein [Gemmatimonadota bacterium]
MTPDSFRRLALSFPGAEEKKHMDHPDFRVGGRIFASLGYPDSTYATIMISPEDQLFLVRDYPEAFSAARGAWGRAGATSVLLRRAPQKELAIALEAAWRRRSARRAK